MKADLHSWEFLGIPRNSQKAGNSFRKGSLVLLEDCRREREKCYFEGKIIEIWDDSGVTAQIEADEDQTISVPNDFEPLEEIEGKKMTQLYIGYQEVTV